ncbi:MAG: hypothetical protein NTV46_01615 [Verrucomicrobia bacterium]|nr:hypothetical protein [Verrucomicrobiota bacterium]
MSTLLKRRTGMSTLLIALALTALSHALEPDERVMLIPWTKAPKEAPVFFAA